MFNEAELVRNLGVQFYPSHYHQASTDVAMGEGGFTSIIGSSHQDAAENPFTPAAFLHEEDSSIL